MKPVVTYIMPSIRTGQDFTDSVKQILAQTLHEIELYVINQAKGRKRPEWLSDDRVIWMDRVGKDRVEVMNEIISNCNGEIVMFACDDDVYFKEHAELFYKESIGNDVVVGGRIVLDADRPVIPYIPVDGYRFEDFKSGKMLSLSAAAIKTDFLRRTGIRFRTDLSFAADMAMFYDLFIAGAKFGAVSSPTMVKVVQEGSISADHSLKSLQWKLGDMVKLRKLYGDDILIQKRVLEFTNLMLSANAKGEKKMPKVVNNSSAYHKYPPDFNFLGKKTLNLGCGFAQYKASNVVNLDAEECSNADVVWDLSKTPLPFENESFDFVFANHIIEHVPNWWKCFEDCARVLKVGGQMEIWVPGDGNSDQLGYRDHINIINKYSFWGIRGLDRNANNAWAEANKKTGVGDLLLEGQTLNLCPNKWLKKLPRFAQLWCAEHLRNVVFEQGFMFKKLPPLETRQAVDERTIDAL